MSCQALSFVRPSLLCRLSRQSSPRDQRVSMSGQRSVPCCFDRCGALGFVCFFLWCVCRRVMREPEVVFVVVVVCALCWLTTGCPGVCVCVRECLVYASTCSLRGSVFVVTPPRRVEQPAKSQVKHVAAFSVLFSHRHYTATCHQPWLWPAESHRCVCSDVFRGQHTRTPY